MWKTDILFWKLFEQLWTRQEYVIYDWKMAMDWLQCFLINVILYSCYHDIFCYQYEGSIISMILPIWIFINSSTKILRYFLNWDKCNCFLLSFGFISASRILNFFSLLHICKETKFCNTKKKKKKKIRRQNETQTLRKSDTFCSKVRKRGEDININHKKEKQTLGIKRGMEHKEIQKENSKTN